MGSFSVLLSSGIILSIVCFFRSSAPAPGWNVTYLLRPWQSVYFIIFMFAVLDLAFSFSLTSALLLHSLASPIYYFLSWAIYVIASVVCFFILGVSFPFVVSVFLVYYWIYGVLRLN